MHAVSSIFKLLSPREVFRKLPNAIMYPNSLHTKNYTDKTNTNKPADDPATKKTTLKGTENEERLRVRRARPGDVPRVMRFVREHARTTWPGPIMPPASTSHIILYDYVARALSQGHSMLAEQHETYRGWSQIRGLALGVAVCPWDAAMIERWAQCFGCMQSRKLMHFAAHCLRAPALHDKYRVHNILQVILIVPPETPKRVEITQILAKNAIDRGRDVGFPLLRFDVTCNNLAKILEELQLKKEWHLSYDVLPDLFIGKKNIEASNETEKTASGTDHNKTVKDNFIAVYTAITRSDK